jgi:hypothetical protein
MVHRESNIVRFNLDNSRTNLVFQDAEGFWLVQAPSDRPDGWSRIFLQARVVAEKLVPPMIMDYAASRALPRATKWIVPYFTETEGQMYDGADVD